MFKWMLGFITGVILLYFSDNLINSSKESLNYYFNLQLIILGFSCALFLYGLFLKQTRFRGIAIYLLFLCVGFSYANYTNEKLTSAQIPSLYDQKIIQIKEKSRYNKKYILNERMLLGEVGGLSDTLEYKLDQCATQAVEETL